MTLSTMQYTYKTTFVSILNLHGMDGISKFMLDFFAHSISKSLKHIYIRYIVFRPHAEQSLESLESG